LDIVREWTCRFSLSLNHVPQIFPSKVLALTLLIAPAPLFAQPDADLKAHLAARRIEVASMKVEKVKAMVEMGVEARIKLDAAQRDLEDEKDKAILEGPSDDAAIEAAQRRIDRCSAWIERIQKLTDNGIAPSLDLILTPAELQSRQVDLTLAQARVRLKAEMAEAALRNLPHQDASTLLDFADGKMEHFEGLGAFDEARELGPLSKAFEAEFERPLPISADGETDVHRALGFDHRGRVDVALDPREPEGIWLRQYLRSRKIPYYAFTSAIAGKATAAHIHIGPGSVALVRPPG
jgi:hypothetical protein